MIKYSQKDLNEKDEYVWLEKMKYALFLSQQEYQQITGEQVTLEKGEYLTITHSNYESEFWNHPDDLIEVQNPVTHQILKPAYKGNVENDNLINISAPYAYILSDEDFLELSHDLDESFKEHLVLIQMKDSKDSYQCMKAIRNEYVAHATSLSDHCGFYDAYEEKLANEAGESYSYSGQVLKNEIDDLMQDWKYAPSIKVLKHSDALKVVAVFILLSACICTISLSSIAIMAYIRSVTIGMQNKKLFEDLRRLGANSIYLKRVLKQQLHCIFTYPLMAGEVGSLGFVLLMCIFNDMHYTQYEVLISSFVLLLGIILSAVMYGIYRISYRSTSKILTSDRMLPKKVLTIRG